MRSYETELHAAEARVAEDRRALQWASSEWLREKRDAAVSGRGLLAATAAGFTLGGLARKRAPKPEKPASIASRVLAVLAGLAAAAIRARYGDPWTATSRLLLHRGTARAAYRPRRAVRSEPYKG